MALRADSTLELDYTNSFWPIAWGDSPQREIGVIHADTLILNRHDDFYPTYTFRFAFRCVSQPAIPCT